MLHVVILAGGRGERFWPLSNSERPKQLLALTGGRTMFEETLDRALAVAPAERVHVVTTQAMAERLAALADRLPAKSVFVEPQGRNTCTAIGVVAAHLAEKDDEAVMAVLSADHTICPVDRFVETVDVAREFVEKNPSALMTIGIPPSRAETGYGYIELGSQVEARAGFKVFHVASFKEKPGPTQAHQYLLDQKHLWNSGMFVWRAHAVLHKIAEHLPELGRLLSTYAAHVGTPQEAGALADLYDSAPSISIDYAILEQAEGVHTVVGNFAWDDVGSWNSLYRLGAIDRAGNVAHGRVVSLDSYECVIHNTDGEGMIALLGVSDLIVVRTPEVTLVAHRTKDQEIRRILAKLATEPDLAEFT